jgi:hypothetical protein
MDKLVGNRLALVGAVLYLLEWVAIIAAAVNVPASFDAGSTDVVKAYSGHAGAFGWAAGWFSVVLLGRVLFTVGVRTALRESGRPQALMDVAVAAMTVSVALEVATFAITTGIAQAPADAVAVRMLDSSAHVLDNVVAGPLAVSVLCTGIAMWQSALFARWLAAVGAGIGAVLTVAALALMGPSRSGALDAATSVFLLWWVWLLWVGVVLWRHHRPANSAAPEPALVRDAG